MTPISTPLSNDLWLSAIDLAKAVHVATASFPRREVFGLSAQLRRTSVALASHVAEGAAGRSSQELLRHLQGAHSAFSELNTQLLLAERFGFMECRDIQDEIKLKVANCGDLIHVTLLSLRERQRRLAIQKAALGAIR